MSAVATGAAGRQDDDPVLRSATFLNEIGGRHPGALSLAAGRPHARFLENLDPVELLAEHTRASEAALGAATTRRDLCQYGETAGLIREPVARLLAVDCAMNADPDDIVVVNGAQEGMLLALRATCSEPRDVLLVAAPCYIGMLGAAHVLGVPVVGVEERADGLHPDDVAATARRVRATGRRPRALYVVPTFSNPSGRTIPTPARRALLEVAAHEDILVIEDDPYRFVSADAPPTLASLPGGDRVIHVGTFAKTCFPGARVGYVVTQVPGLSERISLLRGMTTVNTAPLAQGVIAAMLERSGGSLVAANRDAAGFYRRSMRILLDSLAGSFAHRPDVGWVPPDGGFFAVVDLPIGADEELLGVSARDHGVLWTPMRWFHPGGHGGRHQIRLSCSALDHDLIPEAVARLARLVDDRTPATHRSRPQTPRR